MLRRNITQKTREALSDTPVVLLHGARQTGKTTLARQLTQTEPPVPYLTLDEPGVLTAATADPVGFVAGLAGPTILDEVQKAPELLPAIKLVVDREPDRKRIAGRFLLTGSANVLSLPRAAESLAGRMEVVTLWPFSGGELNGLKEGFVDRLFQPEPLPPTPGEQREPERLWQLLVQGGYPEAVARSNADRRSAWFDSYVSTILQRDVRDLANIEGLQALPRLLALLAARTATLLNYAELARTAGLPQSTLKRYFALLEATFLAQSIPPWSSNLSKRLVKAPKVLITDSGLSCHLVGADLDRLRADPTLTGRLLEGFVLMELRKQLSWSRTRAQLFHFRTQNGQEVDAVLESPAGKVVGIEVKARATISDRDLRGLRALEQAAGPHFLRGVLLYTGRQTVPFSSNLHAVPLEQLWRLGSSASEPPLAELPQE